MSNYWIDVFGRGEWLVKWSFGVGRVIGEELRVEDIDDYEFWGLGSLIGWVCENRERNGNCCFEELVGVMGLRKGILG